MVIRKTQGLSKNLEKVIQDLKHIHMRVGWGENQKYPDGTPVAEVAATNEFGSPAKHIPPRSFMRSTIMQETENWKRTTAKGLKLVVNGSMTIHDSMESMGLKVAGDIKKTISTITAPALATSTIEARLRGKKQGKSVSLSIAKPLVDTGLMMNSLTSEVVSK